MSSPEPSAGLQLDHAGYRTWVGEPRSSWWSCLSIVRVGLMLIFRRWIFWILIGLGLLNFLFHFAFIYLKATLAVQNENIARFLDRYKVTGTGDAYAEFMFAQATICALLLAFAASTLIGGDYRQGGMIFYLSRRIGRWQGRNPAAAGILDVVVLKDKKQRAMGLQLSCSLEKGTKSDLAKGAYLLRTNCIETDPAKLWRWYVQLTQAEAAFRTAKSDIGLRPVYHRKTERVEAHLLVCFLSLALWRSLEMWMQSKGLGSNARKLINAIKLRDPGKFTRTVRKTDANS